MKKIFFMQIVKQFKNIENQRNFLLVILLSLIIFHFNQCNKTNDNNISYEQNIAALTDTIRSYKTETGKLVFQKKSLITTINDLEKYSSDLSKKYEELENNPITITKFKTKIIRDTNIVIVYDNSYSWNDDSSKISIKHKWADSANYSSGNYRYLTGEFTSKLDTTFSVIDAKMKIYRDEFGLSFTTGIMENKNGLAEIYIQSDFPGFTPTSIEGALLDPRESDIIKSYFPPKRWGIGIYSGYGIYGDFGNFRFGHGFNIGVGVSYNLIQF